MNIIDELDLKNLLNSVDPTKPCQFYIDFSTANLFVTHNCLFGSVATRCSSKPTIIFPILCSPGWYGPEAAKDSAYVKSLCAHINYIYNNKDQYLYDPLKVNIAPWLV